MWNAGGRRRSRNARRPRVLVAWGTIVVGLIDNIIYPILVGRRLRLHSTESLVAILDGLALFGSSGIVLGPVIFAISQSLLLTVRQRTTDGLGQLKGQIG